MADTVGSMNAKNEEAVRIGRRISVLRESRDRMTRKELAEAVGVTDGYIRAIEVGAKAVTSLDLADRLARALKVSREELLGDESEADERRRLREERERFEVAVKSIAEIGASMPTGTVGVKPGFATVPNDPRMRLFLRKAEARKEPLTDEQWEELLRILEEDDDEG